jgi:nitrous oxidase accessory protein
MKKLLVVGVILLFLGSSIPVLAHSNENSLPSSRGNCLYVGGSGQGNYSKIQDALNSSKDGDTIFVYNGIYTEHLFIEKQISLLGESRNSTRIQRIIEEPMSLISIFNNHITISGFSLELEGNVIYGRVVYADSHDNLTIRGNNIHGGKGIFPLELFLCNNCKISENYVFNTSELLVTFSDFFSITNNIIENSSIVIGYGSGGIISNNTFLNFFQCGLQLSGSCNTKVLDNNFHNTTYGIIATQNASRIAISNNSIDDGLVGIFIYHHCMDINVTNNLIEHCSTGISLSFCSNTRVIKNFLLSNKVQAKFNNTRHDKWSQNFWGRPRILPKVIEGRDEKNKIIYELDWRPSIKPYDISTLN